MTTRRKNIPDGDYALILNALERDGSMRALACTLMVYTGARANEILRTTHKTIEVNEKGGEIIRVSILVKASKRGQDRWIDLPNELHARIKDLRDELKEEKSNLASLIMLNPSSSHQSTIDSAYEQCRLFIRDLQLDLFGEARYTLHAFRHTLAVRALKAGYNIIELKATLGHGHINSTYEYLKEYEKSIVLSNVHKLVKGK